MEKAKRTGIVLTGTESGPELNNLIIAKLGKEKSEKDQILSKMKDKMVSDTDRWISDMVNALFELGFKDLD